MAGRVGRELSKERKKRQRKRALEAHKKLLLVYDDCKSALEKEKKIVEVLNR